MGQLVAVCKSDWGYIDFGCRVDCRLDCTAGDRTGCQLVCCYNIFVCHSYSNCLISTTITLSVASVAVASCIVATTAVDRKRDFVGIAAILPGLVVILLALCSNCCVAACTFTVLFGVPVDAYL